VAHVQAVLRAIVRFTRPETVDLHLKGLCGGDLHWAVRATAGALQQNVIDAEWETEVVKRPHSPLWPHFHRLNAPWYATPHQPSVTLIGGGPSCAETAGAALAPLGHSAMSKDLWSRSSTSEKGVGFSFMDISEMTSLQEIADAVTPQWLRLAVKGVLVVYHACDRTTCTQTKSGQCGAAPPCEPQAASQWTKRVKSAVEPRLGVQPQLGGGFQGLRLDHLTLLHPSMGHKEAVILVAKRSVNETISAELRLFTKRETSSCSRMCLHHSLQVDKPMCGKTCLKPKGSKVPLQSPRIEP